MAATTQDQSLDRNHFVDSAGQQDMEKSPDSDVEQNAQKSGPPVFPEGGSKAWLVVLGAMMVNSCSFGYVSSFGVFQTYYQQHQLSHMTSSNISWIGSLQLCFLFGSGLFAGALFDRYGARRIVIPAAISHVFSVMMISLCKEYYQFILAQGILGGISIGFLFTPSLSVVSHYFNAKRGAATGVVVVGSSIGGVTIPIILQKSFDSHTLGFGWGVRVLGFGMLIVLTMACALIKERLPPRSGAFFAFGAFRQPGYTLLVVGIFFLFWGIFLPFFFITDYALLDIHMSSNLAFYLLSILNGVSLAGRMISGASADKVGWMNLLTVAAAINAVLLFCWTSTNSNAGLIVWTAMFGFSSGGVFALFPAALARLTPSPQLIGTYVGQAMLVFGLAGLTGSPIAGAIINQYGFADASYFAGCSALAATVLIAAARFCQSQDLMVVV